MYPDAHCELDFTTPLELLVATILSAQCTDRRVNQVTPVLFARYRSAADYAEADPAVWDDGLRFRVTDELADVLLYLLRFADVCGIDPVAAAHAKIDRNEVRFPAP